MKLLEALFKSEVNKAVIIKGSHAFWATWALDKVNIDGESSNECVTIDDYKGDEWRPVLREENGREFYVLNYKYKLPIEEAVVVLKDIYATVKDIKEAIVYSAREVTDDDMD